MAGVTKAAAAAAADAAANATADDVATTKTARPRLTLQELGMNSRLSFLLALAATLLGAGCGGAHKAVPNSGSLGELLVKQTIDRTGPIPIEGAYSYVRIENPGGDKVTEERLPSDGKTTIRLGSGSYTTISYQRTCDGNCGNLDAASERCSSRFTISSDKRLGANVQVTYGSGCKIRFAPAPD